MENSASVIHTDPLYAACVDFAVENGQVSTATLQKHFNFPYDRAARILDEMEENHVIAPYTGDSHRQVLIRPQTIEMEWEQDRSADVVSNLTQSLESNGNGQRFSGSFLSNLCAPFLHQVLHQALRWIFKPIPFAIYLLTVLFFWLMLRDLPDRPFLLLEIAAALAVFYIPLRLGCMIFYYMKIGWNNLCVKSHQKVQSFKKWNDTFTDSTPHAPTALAMDTMDGHQFEYFCADLLRNNGFREVEVTQASGDYGIDVLAEKDGVTYAIQCKCYSGNVGNHAVQEAHSGADYYNRMVAVVMTNSYFTKAAKETAAQTKVLLWDRDKLLQMINK